MKYEEYKEKKDALNTAISQLKSRRSDLTKDFIESNKPCQLDDSVEITTASDRKIKGQAKSFQLFIDKVIVSSVKPLDGKPMIYISVPYKSITVL